VVAGTFFVDRGRVQKRGREKGAWKSLALDNKKFALKVLSKTTTTKEEKKKTPVEDCQRSSNKTRD